MSRLAFLVDGTTDVTRTFHFGRATQRQREIYTRVLMGAIDLATLVFPDSIDDTRIDVIARQHLYQIGLDYGHGTGHGIGSFLNVHESACPFESNFNSLSSSILLTGPIQLRINSKEPHKFQPNFFFSDGNILLSPLTPPNIFTWLHLQNRVITWPTSTESDWKRSCASST
jgi:Xaa-Pro aminopeptidase